MSVAYKIIDRSVQFYNRYREASRLAVDASAALYEGNLKKRFFQGYYTSQAFRSTAQIVQHISRERPVLTGEGWVSTVGIPRGPQSKAQPNAKPSQVWLIAMAWELGHHNLFTRKFERVPIFKPVAMDSAKAIMDTYKRVMNRYIEHGRAV